MTRAILPFLFSLLSCAAFAACGSSQPGSNATGGDAGQGDAAPGDAAPGDGGAADSAPGMVVAPPGQIELQVQHARRALVGGQPDDLQIEMTLANGAGAPPASLNTSLFQMKTADGIYHSAVPANVEWVPGAACDSSLSVGASASLTCVLSFSLKIADVAVELSYRTPNAVAGVGSDQRSASTPVTVEPCTTCGQDCTYLDIDPRHCGACDGGLGSIGYDPPNEGNSSTPRCVNGAQACQPASSGAVFTRCTAGQEPVCLDLQTSTKGCGACDHTVGYGACVNGAPQCAMGSPTATCGATSCADLSGIDNCGACGASCKAALPDASTLFPRCQYTGDGGAAVCHVPDYAFNTNSGDPIDGTTTCTEACQSKGFSCLDSAQYPCSRTPTVSGVDLYLPCDCSWLPK